MDHGYGFPLTLYLLARYSGLDVSRAGRLQLLKDLPKLYRPDVRLDLLHRDSPPSSPPGAPASRSFHTAKIAG